MTIDGSTSRSIIKPMGGRFMLPISAESRGGAGVAAGDVVDVEVEIDNEPREVVVPADFAEALANAATAKQAFDRKSYSNQLRHVLAIEAAKAAQTRQRRIEKTVATLRAGT